MANDVEMNEVKTSLLESNDASKENNDVNVAVVDFKISKDNEEFTGLTKEELEKFAKDPFWRKLRLVLFIVFWLIWVAMLVIAVLIVLLSPKCPKTPKLEFWEKETGYWVDTLGFVDSNGDGVGDLEGLISKLSYIQTQVGAGYLILDPIFSGQYSSSSNVVGLVNSFRDLDSIIGNKESFKKLIKESRKRGLEIILSVDFNALSVYSDFLKKNPDAVTKWNSQMESWVNREGKSCKETYNSKEVYKYASDKSNMLDLDLRNEVVIKEIEESVKMWLDYGVRGFLMTNVAVYVENATFPALPTDDKINVNKWYTVKSMQGQIFSAETSVFLKRIRNVMDDVAKNTDKSRLMILDAGNIGFGLEADNINDPMTQYLGKVEKIADMVISREFLSNRGWSTNNLKLSKSSVNNYLQVTNKFDHKRFALTSATSTSLRTNELHKMAAPFLLPGNPIIYFGSEIGDQCDASKINTIKVPFYPQSHKFPLDGVNNELPVRCNHMIMPWDNSGKGFSNGNKTIDDLYIINAKSTVQGLTAIGREETILQLYQKLIKVRNDHSLQWGNINTFINEKTLYSSYEIFIREAVGFPKIIVALLQDKIEGRVFSFNSICAKVKPIVVYPSNPKLQEDKEINTENIYLKISNGESIHVFKCIE